MNWGKGITIVILVFLTAMLGMVYVASRQTNEMIDDHYYERELAYQQVIDAQQRTVTAQDLPLVSVQNEGVLIQIPSTIHPADSGGTATFLRLSNQQLDRRFALAPDSAGRQLIPAAEFFKGEYRFRLQWQSGGETYYREENIYWPKS